MRNILLALPVALNLLYEGCETKPPVLMHTPVAAQAFDMKKKGDVQVRTLYAWHGVTNGDASQQVDKVTSFDAQAAIALTNRLLVQAHGSFKREANGYIPDGQSAARRKHKYTRNIAGLAIGYYRPVNAKKTLFFSITGGYGAGKYTADIFTKPYSPPRYYYDNNVNHAFVTSSLYQSIGLFNYGVGLRYTSAGHEKISTNFTLVELVDERLDKLSTGRAHLLEGYLKMGITPRKLPWLSFEVQATAGGDISNRIHYANGLLVSGGLRFNLNKFRVR
jgi:hypothetical protein